MTITTKLSGGIYIPALSGGINIDRYTSASVTTTVYGRYREISVDYGVDTVTIRIEVHATKPTATLAIIFSKVLHHLYPISPMYMYTSKNANVNIVFDDSLCAIESGDMQEFFDNYSGEITSFVCSPEQTSISTTKAKYFNHFLGEYKRQKMFFETQGEKYTIADLQDTNNINAIIMLARNLEKQRNSHLRILTLNFSILPAFHQDSKLQAALRTILSTIHTLRLQDSKVSEQFVATLIKTMEELRAKCRLKNFAIMSGCTIQQEMLNVLFANLNHFASVDISNFFHVTNQELGFILWHPFIPLALDLCYPQLSKQQFAKELTIKIENHGLQLENLFSCLHKLSQVLINNTITLDLSNGTLSSIPVQKQAITENSAYPNVIALLASNTTWLASTLEDLTLILKNSPCIKSLFLDGGIFDSRDHELLEKMVQSSTLNTLSLNNTNLSNDQLFRLAAKAFANGVTTLHLQGTKFIQEENIRLLIASIKEECGKKTKQALTVDLRKCTMSIGAFTYLQEIFPTMANFQFTLLIDEELQTGAIKTFIQTTALHNSPVTRQTLKESMEKTMQTLNGFPAPSAPPQIDSSYQPIQNLPDLSGVVTANHQEETAATSVPRTAYDIIQRYEEEIRKSQNNPYKDTILKNCINTLFEFNKGNLLPLEYCFRQAQHYASLIKSESTKIEMYSKILAVTEENMQKIDSEYFGEILIAIYNEHRLNPIEILNNDDRENFNKADRANLNKCEELLVKHFKQKIITSCNQLPKQKFSVFTQPNAPELNKKLSQATNLYELQKFLSTYIKSINAAPIKPTVELVLETIGHLPPVNSQAFEDSKLFESTNTPGG